ncbi:MAG: flagellar protein [Lachnospiraceae bacterium]
MDVRNCRGCGRLFNYLQGPPLCSACIADLEEKFQQVKEYLRENPKAPLNRTAEENDVTVKQIKQWVREERLSFTEESQIKLDCELCGAPILTGRFCDKCKLNMHEEFKGAMQKPKSLESKKSTRDRDKMRFLDN